MIPVRARWLEVPIEPGWLKLLLLPLLPIGWTYGAIAGLHRMLYRKGWRRGSRVPCRVVSVGSLVAGGAGKTPVAAWLAAALHRRGHKVVLASRGYGRLGRNAVVVVSDGRLIRSRWEECGDEPLVLAAHAVGVPVLVGANRSLVGWRALSTFGADVLVLDDGFQHHALERDVDVVLFDGGLGFGSGFTLPRGPLRERPSALRAADVIGVIDGPLAPSQQARLEALAPDTFCFHAQRRPVSLRPLAGGPGEPLQRLEGAEVGMLSGVAQPRNLRRTLEALGARVVAERSFRDHHHYRIADLVGLDAQAPLWITTEKDAVKIPRSWVRDADVRVLGIELYIEDGGALLDQVEARLRAAPRRYPRR